MKKHILFIIFILLANSIFGQVFDTVSYYKKYTTQQLRQDLNFLLNKFEEIHPNYFIETPKDTVIKRYSNLESSITKPMTRMDFMNLFAPVVYGVIKDGHNYVNASDEDLKLYTDRGGKFFPIPIKIKNDKLLVTGEIPDIPFGTEITSINGRTSTEVIKKILSSYNPENREYEENFMSYDFNKLYWFNYGNFSQYELTYLIKPGLIVKKIKLSGKSQPEIDQQYAPQKKKSYLLNDPNYGYYELPEISTGVLDYKVCDDLSNFRPFCDSLFTLLSNKRYKNLIIDIRNNEGGTTRLNDILFEYLTDKPITQYTEIDTKVSNDEKNNFIAVNRKYNGWFKWYNYIYYPVYITIVR